jgi:hypothetical protein
MSIEPTSLDAPAGVRGSRIASAGLLFAGLFLVAWLLLRSSPDFDATDQELRAYYEDPDQRQASIIAALYVVPLAAIAFIWFMAALRDRYVRSSGREHTILSTAHVVAGTLVVVSLFLLATVELSVGWLAGTSDTLDVGGARALLALGQAASDIMTLRAAAVFVAISTSRGVRSGLFPRAFGVLSVLVALTLLFVYASVQWVGLLFPAWVAASSILILIRRHGVGLADDA